MKYFMLLLLVLVLTVLMPVLAFASVWGTVTGFVADNAVLGLISLFVVLLGAVFKLTGVMYDVSRLKPALIKMYDVYGEWKKAGSPGSPGGTKRTAEEYEIIIKKFTEAIIALWAAVPPKWLPSKMRK